MLMAVMATAMALGAPGDAPAPQPAPPPTGQLQALVQSPDYQRNIARLFATLPPDVFQRCAALVSSGSTVTMMTPVTFAANGYPLSGLWRQSFPVRGCGNDTTINFFFRGQPDTNIASIIGVPGETRADLTLQRDAVQFAHLGAQAIAPGCTDAHVRHTRYDGVIDTKSKAWRESWIVAACGRTVEVPMTFTPDRTGTTITVQPPRAAG